jgi:hypothetical protein
MIKQTCSEPDDQNNHENTSENTREASFRFRQLDPMTRQTIIENSFGQKKDTGEKLGKIFRNLIAKYGCGFISRAELYRRWNRYLANPDTAGADGRKANHGFPKELNESEKAAWEVVSAHYCHYKAGFSAALTYLGKVARMLEIPRSAFPTIHQCYYRWSKEDPDFRAGMIEDPHSAFSRAQAWTHRAELNPDDEHQVDEGEYTLFSWEKKKKAKIYYCRQIDAATGLIRATHFSRERFKDRDTVLGLKMGCKKSPPRGIYYNCLPKSIRLDRATWHRTKNIQRINYLLRNREGRRSRIQLNPGETPRANCYVERNIGETKRKPLRMIAKNFETFLKTKRISKPLLANSLAYVESIERQFDEFDHWHNHAGKTRSTKTRIDEYRDGVPIESLSITDAEIDEIFIYYRRMKFTGHGVELDGVAYDSKEDLYKYRGKRMWVGVAPESNQDEPSEVAYLAIEDSETVFRIVGTLTRPKNDKLFTRIKQKSWTKNHSINVKKVKERGDAIDAINAALPPTVKLDKPRSKPTDKKQRPARKPVKPRPAKPAPPKRIKIEVSKSK